MAPVCLALKAGETRAERRLGARYSQSLLSGRRAVGLPAKEPN